MVKRLHQPDPHTEQIFLEAEAYQRKGDVYTAVKLYKKTIRLAPSWARPYVQLGTLYKDRADWKTCLHYTNKALLLDESEKEAWTNLGLAATALKKWKAARQAWNRLGYEFKETDHSPDFDLGTVAIYLNPRSRPEVVWARRLDPARATLLSIPQPGSSHRYLDTVLFDPASEGTQVVGARRWPAYRALQILKSSPYKTFSVELLDVTLPHVDVLSQLCGEEGIGFDNWSATTHLYLPPTFQENPEFHLHPFPRGEAAQNVLVGLAAKSLRPLQRILRNWEIITLCHYKELQQVY
ncbi:MAG: hypothetical protein IPG32_19765 [Saprospirales bacterium]|nr:hypothetical protein [Saprospirales bacterium]